MTETTNKRKNADDLPAAKKTLKRMSINSSQGAVNSSCKGQPNEERICKIFQNEIDTEIGSKIKDLEIIQERLKQCHKDLNLLRKAVVTMYYEPTYKKSTKFDQHRIHPAVQKLIGKRPVNEQPVHEDMFEYSTRPLTRHMRKEETTHQETPANEKNEQTFNRIENVNIEEKVPQYIPPNLSVKRETRFPRGNRQKKLIRILVGNVSKRVTDGSHDKATHKWMLYIRSEGLLEIGKDISKVRFFLHPSYKPHDVVTIPKAPFTLTRRGWGEFPVRVQLHFHNPLNKPVDILHRLKLDGVSSGPHSRSAETLADIWVYCNDQVNRPSSNCETSEYSDSGSVQQGCSSPSNSSEVSDSNTSSYNVNFSVNESEFLNGSECSNPSENSQSINVTSLISKCNFKPHDGSDANADESEESEVTDFPSNGGSGKLDYLNTRTTFNNKVFNVAAKTNQQNIYLSKEKEFFASENNVDDNSNCLFKDLKIEDFNEVLNIDNITNNIDMSISDFIECSGSVNGEVTTVNGFKGNFSDLSYVLGTTNTTNEISNLSNKQNISVDLGFGHEVDNSKPKTPDKNIQVTDNKLYSNTYSLNNQVTERFNDCRINSFDDKFSIRNEPKLFGNTEEFPTEYDGNIFSNYDHKYAESIKFKSEAEVKIKIESPDENIKIEADNEGNVIKEEIIEIDDCYSNWLDEVVIDAVQGTDVIKVEPLSPKQDGCQELSVPADGLTNSIEDFLNSTIECHLGELGGLKENFSFSSNINENVDLLETIDEKLSSLSETLPINESYLSCETNDDLVVKNTIENKLDNTILELHSLDSFENYLSSPVKNFEVDIEPSPNIQHCNATDNLTTTQLNVELPDKDLLINKELKLSSTNNCELKVPKDSVTIGTNTSYASKNISSDVTTITKSPQNNLMSKQLTAISSAIRVPKLVNINSAGLVGSSSVSSSTSSVHKGTKQMKVVFRNKDGIISSTPNGQNIVLLQTNNKKESFNILPNRVALMKNKNSNPLKCVYIPPTNNNKTSILRTVPGVSLLKKNLVVSSAIPVASNSVSVPLIFTSAPFQQSLQKVKIYPTTTSRIILSNGTIGKVQSQHFKGAVKPIKDELIVSSSRLSQRTLQIPLTGSLQAAKETKTIVLNRTESKKMNFDGRITQLQSSLE